MQYNSFHVWMNNERDLDKPINSGALPEMKHFTEYALNTVEVRMSECLKGCSLSSKSKEAKLKIEEVVFVQSRFQFYESYSLLL